VLTLDELLARWEARHAEGARLRAIVPLEVVAAEVLEGLRELQGTNGSEFLSLTDAARLSGYSPDHLGRLIRQGIIPNAGRIHAPAIRRSDVPLKPGTRGDGQRASKLVQSKAQIARAVVQSFREANDGI
jgi:hypothetical protein